MRGLLLPLSLVLSGVIPLLLGRLGAGWLMNQLWPEAQDSLFAWVLGMFTAVSLTLLFIAAWAFYRDKVWRGLMHPLAFMSSIALVIISLLTLPTLWGELRLLAEGETAVGTIEALATGIDHEPEANITHTAYYVVYRFSTGTGDDHNNRVQVSHSLYQSFREGEAINISYLPHKPSYSLPEVGIRPEKRVHRIFTLLLAVYVALAETAIIMLFVKGTSNRLID